MSGIAAEFAVENALVGATSRLCEAGITRLDAYTPYPVEALDDPAAAAAHCAAGAGVFRRDLRPCRRVLHAMVRRAVSYPLNIGGRPLASWPAFIPIAFEIAVLCAVASGFFGFFALARLPQPYQPIAALPGFERATQDRFFLIIDAADPRFDAARVVELIEEFSPCSVVPWRP